MINLCHSKYLIFLFLIFGKSTKAQIKIDTNFSYEQNRKSLPVLIKLDTLKLKSTDTLYKNKLYFYVSIFGKARNESFIYHLKEKEYLNNGKERLSEILGYDTTSYIFNDSVFITQLLQKKEIPLALVKTEIEEINIKDKNILLTYWPILLGSLLACIGLIPLFKKNKNMANLKKDEFLQKAILLYKTGDKKTSYENILKWISDDKEDLKVLANAKLKNEDALISSKADIELLKNTIKEHEAKISNLELANTKSVEFDTLMLKKYISQFNEKFAAGASSYPMPMDEKKIFTETIYAIAFHYLSHLKNINDKYDSNDAANLKFLQGIKEINLDTVSISEKKDIQKYNAIIIHIADELDRNGVTELKDVNFRGNYFKG